MDGARQKGLWLNDVFQDPNPKPKPKEEPTEEESMTVELSDSVYIGTS